MNRTPLQTLLAPRSVALIGVSAEDRGFGINGRTVLNHLVRHGYAGRVVPIHPRVPEIAGHATAPSLAALGEPVDCALVAVAAADVLEQVKACVAAGIRSVVVLSAQFAEVGAAGAARQDELAAYARANGVALAGPNTTGFVRMADGLALSATASLQNRTLLRGPLALVTQSGALGGALLDRACDTGVGLSYLIGTGNEAVLQAADYVDYLIDDPETRAVALYLETLRSPARFLAVADRAAGLGKALVVFKVGRTAAGARAALSHTGGIAGEYDAYVAALEAHGVVVVDSLDDLLGTASTLAHAPRPRGPRVGMYTFSGALGVALTDRLAEHGLQLPELAPHTVEALTAAMGPLAVPHNPFDVVPQSVYEKAAFRDSFLAVAEDPAVDAVVLTLMPVAAGRVDLVTSVILEVARTVDKPLLVFWYCGAGQPGLDVLRAANIPVFLSLEGCAVAARHLLMRPPAPASSEPRPVDERRRAAARAFLEGRRGALSEWESRELLLMYGLPFGNGQVVASRDDAVRAAVRVGLPAVLKIVSREITHKAAAGGVRVGLQTADAVGDAFEAMLAEVARRAPGAKVDGALVQRQIGADVEVMLGLRADLDVGPVVVVGHGGALTEHLGDHAMALAPADAAAAEALIARTRVGRALAAQAPGWPALREELVRAVLGLGDLARDAGDLVSEVELNPLRVSLGGVAVAVDALVVTREQPRA